MSIARKAYERAFRKHVAYRQCFLGDDGNLSAAAKIVLADLAKFGGLQTGPTVVSPISRVTDVPATMQRLGRGDVVYRIRRFLRLDVNQLLDNIEGADANE